MESEENSLSYPFLPKPNPPPDWITDTISTFFETLTAPVFSLFSIASQSYHRAEAATTTVEKAVQEAPTNFTHGGTVLVKKIGLGILGALHVSMVLLMAMVLAVLLGVWFVQLWVEEPLFVKERIYFDYTDVNPYAVFSLRDGSAGSKSGLGVPVGHTVRVSLVLLMPESDFNRHVGVFQLTAELFSKKGDLMARSSQPCMLRFRSLPIRLTRTFVFGVPLVLGLSSETQMITTDVLTHKEGNKRSDAIRVSISPRAGTLSLPQLYEAHIIIKSKLPWTKQLIHNWKWTLYVWTSLNVYIALLIILVTCFRPLLFPAFAPPTVFRTENVSITGEEIREQESRGGDYNNISELMRKWKQRRGKRKAVFLQKAFPEAAGSSASSIDVSGIADEDVGDSESVCLGR